MSDLNHNLIDLKNRLFSVQGRNVLLFSVLAVLIGGVFGIAIVKINQPAYILLGFLFLFIFAGSILYTEFGLLVLVFLIYTRVSDILVHNYDLPSVAQLYIALLFGAILGRWVLYREVPQGWLKSGVLISIYGLICFISLVFASDMSRAYDALIVLFKDAIIMVLVVILLQNGASFRRIIWILMGIGIFLGTISCFQFLTGTFTNSYWGFASARVMEITGTTSDYRIGGPVSDANYFAQIMVVIIPLALERFFHAHRKLHRFVALWALAVSTLTVIFTYSRGGFVALAFVVALFFFIYPPRFFQVPILIVSMVVMVFFLPEQYLDRILSLNQLFPQSGALRTNDLSLRDRTTVNLVAFEMLRSNPLLGVGLSNFQTDYDKYAASIGKAIGLTNASAHNLYLEVAAETGILGLASFMALIVSVVSMGWRIRKKFLEANLFDYAGMTTAFSIGLLGYLVGAMFIHGAYPRYFYLLIGIGFALDKVAQNVINGDVNKSA